MEESRSNSPKAPENDGIMVIDDESTAQSSVLSVRGDVEDSTRHRNELVDISDDAPEHHQTPSENDDIMVLNEESTPQPPARSVRREGEGSTPLQQNDDIMILDNESTAHPHVKSARRKIGGSKRHQNDVIAVSEDEVEGQPPVKRGGGSRRSKKSPEAQLRQELIDAKKHTLVVEQKQIWTEQQLDRKEAMYQRACRAVREAEMRAHKAEKLLESPGSRDALSKSGLEKIVNELKDELEKEKKKGQRANEKIDELEAKLAKYESSAKVKRIMEEVTSRKIAPRIYETADEKNIIRLLSANAKHSISIDEAADMVRAVFEECGENAKKRLQEKPEHIECDVCGVELWDKLAVTTHFISGEHIEKVRPHKISVSKLAVDGWVKKLEHLQHSSEYKE